MLSITADEITNHRITKVTPMTYIEILKLVAANRREEALVGALDPKVVDFVREQCATIWYRTRSVEAVALHIFHSK